MGGLHVDSTTALMRGAPGKFQISNQVSPVLMEPARRVAGQPAGNRMVEHVDAGLFEEFQSGQLSRFPGWEKIEPPDRVIGVKFPNGTAQFLQADGEAVKLKTVSQGHSENILFDRHGEVQVHDVHGLAPSPLIMPGKFDPHLLELLTASNPAFATKPPLEGTSKTTPPALMELGFRPIPKYVTSIFLRDDHKVPDYLEHGFAESKQGAIPFIVGLRDFTAWKGQAASFAGPERVGEAVTAAGEFMQVLRMRNDGRGVLNGLAKGPVWANTQYCITKMFEHVGTNWIPVEQMKGAIFDRPDLKGVKTIVDTPEAWVDQGDPRYN